MRTRPRVIRSLALAVPVAALLAGVGEAALGGLTPGDPEPEQVATVGNDRVAGGAGETVDLRLLGVNDFHGRLESPVARLRATGDYPRVPIGGAAVLGAHLDRAAAALPGRTIRVHAGDMVGASPLVSSYFHDEPTIEAMNLMRFDVGTLGNHEFDEGVPEMQRLLRGGRRNDGGQWRQGPAGEAVNTSGADFEGVRFPYIAANAVDLDGRSLLPPTAIVERAGVRVGFIGVTTDTTPDYLLARHSGGLRFLDISQTVNAYVPGLVAQGVRAIVVLAHSGAHERGEGPAAGGEIVDEAGQMSDEVDVVVAGHTHSHLNLEVPNQAGDGAKLVVQAFSYGTAYDQVDMRVDRRTGDVVAKTAETPTTWSDEVDPDPPLDRLVGRYARRAAPLAEQVLGRARRALRRPAAGPARARGLGALAARAQRRLARADVAFVNPGNLRGNLGRGVITYADLFAVAPFEHQVMRMEMTGADILALLARQATPSPAVWLHVSGMRWDLQDGQIAGVTMADGRPLRPERSYTVAANELLAGSKRFSVFTRGGRAMRAVGTDLEALVRLVKRTDGALDRR